MQSTQYEYDASDWLDNEETESNVKESRKASKRSRQDQRRNERELIRKWE